MKFDQNVLELMPHEISLRKRISVDRFNRPTYEVDAAGDPVVTRYRALVTFKPEQIRTMMGEERIARTRITMGPVIIDEDDNLIFLDDLPAITPEHEITLPDGSHPVILAVEIQDGLIDTHHIVIRT